jgi:hypothetical protein
LATATWSCCRSINGSKTYIWGLYGLVIFLETDDVSEAIMETPQTGLCRKYSDW